MNVELNSVERKASKKEVTKRKKKRRRTKRKHDRGRTEDKKNMLFLSFEQKNVFVAVTHSQTRQKLLHSCPFLFFLQKLLHA